MFGDCSILFWLVIRKLLCLVFLFFWPPTISRIYFERGALKYVLSPLIWFVREEKKLSRELWTKITKATCRGQMNENIVVNNSKMTLSHFDCVSAKWLWLNITKHQKWLRLKIFFYTMITDLNDQNINEIRVVLFVYFKAKGKLVYKLKYRSRYVFAALFN